MQLRLISLAMILKLYNLVSELFDLLLNHFRNLLVVESKNNNHNNFYETLYVSKEECF